MKRAHFYCLTFVVVLLFVGISMVSMAEVAVLRVEISGVVSNADARQIRRLLEPWAAPEDITFHTPVDKHGRKRLFTTLVKIKPRQGVSEYSETHTFDVYNIMRQLNDSRFRGRHGIGNSRVLKTEATVRGDLFAHPGFARSYLRNVPSWRRWRPDTSNIHHAMTAGSEEQKFVFSANPEFDQLRIDAANNNKPVQIEGVITGFDGPYPIMSVRKYEIGYHLKTKSSEAETARQPTYDYLERK
jgi:hypothetical protein